MAQFFNLFENLFAAVPMMMVGQDGYLDMLHDNDRVRISSVSKRINFLEISETDNFSLIFSLL